MTAKTNTMRMLDAAGISYDTREYEVDETDLSGTHAADYLGMSYDTVYKTLVTRGTKGLYVFCIPVDAELDLKKAAKAAGEKSLSMLHVKELLGNTGYIRGGCSPIGMKKVYPTFIQEDAMLEEMIAVSAGVRGRQILIAPDALAEFVGARYVDIVFSGRKA